VQVVAHDPLLLPQLAAHPGPKVAAQKIEALLALPEVDHTGLVRMQHQPEVAQQRNRLLLGLLSLRRGPGLMRHPVAHRRDAQRPLAAIRLGDLHPTHRRRAVAACPDAQRASVAFRVTPPGARGSGDPRRRL